MMNLGDSIDLGSTLLEPEQNVWSGHDNGKGCALEMAMAAIGCRRGYLHARTIWPWLDSKRPKGFPCGCQDSWLYRKDYCTAIIHLFGHVEAKDGKFSMRQLIDYVRSVEPATREVAVEEHELTLK